MGELLVALVGELDAEEEEDEDEELLELEEDEEGEEPGSSPCRSMSPPLTAPFVDVVGGDSLPGEEAAAAASAAVVVVEAVAGEGDSGGPGQSIAASASPDTLSWTPENRARGEGE